MLKTEMVESRTKKQGTAVAVYGNSCNWKKLNLSPWLTSQQWMDSRGIWKDSGQTQNIQTLTNQDAGQQRSSQDSMDLERQEN